MEIISIVAIGKNHVIGKNNQMLWHLPNDFKFFKSVTSGHFIIMGRKTFESFPKPLPNRKHIVITQQTNYQVPEGVVVVNSLDKAIDFAKQHKQERVFIIGGGQIYALAQDIVTHLYITYVDFQTEGDAYFPIFDKKAFTSELIQKQEVDDKHAYAFEIYKHQRI